VSSQAPSVISNPRVAYFPQTIPKNYSVDGLSIYFKDRIKNAGCFACSISMYFTKFDAKTTSARYDLRTKTTYNLSPDPVTICLANLGFPQSVESGGSDPVYMYYEKVALAFGTKSSGYIDLSSYNETTKKAKLKDAIDKSNNDPGRSPIILHLNNGGNHYVLVKDYKADTSGNLVDIIINDPANGGGKNTEDIGFADTHRGGSYSNIREYIYFTKN
jgi:hypothetical protein